MPPTLPLVRRTIAIGPRSFVVDSVDDEDALLAHAESAALFPFGLMLWESAIALAVHLAANPTLAAGKSVLELGAGLGLTGVVAASLGATLTQTDHDEAALASCARTAALNGMTGITRQTGDWHAWQDPSQYDLILGADITYDAADHAVLLALFDHALAPAGRILLSDPCRENLALFIARAQSAGWSLTRSDTTVQDLKIPTKNRPIALLALRRRFDLSHKKAGRLGDAIPSAPT